MSMTVSTIPTIPFRPDSAAPAPHALSHHPLSFAWFNRSRRVLYALTAVWVLNLVDLGCTLSESYYVGFYELNPLAAGLIHGSATGLIVYKLSLLTFSSCILLAVRNCQLAEFSCWMLLMTYACVAIRWGIYFQHRMEALNDPASNVCHITGLLY